MLLPLFKDEWSWNLDLRRVLYFLGLGYLFCGVGVVSDIFMSSIEEITAKTTKKMNPTTGDFVRVKVWNATVANLTLMALGSSAPEILLSIIELVGNRMYSGELGPSTIVGSAAFNLLCIIAVCICAIPAGEVRKIKEVPVFVVTTCFSIFAYLWLLMILLVTSPNVVEIWEGVFTFLFFWILIAIAYMADRGYFGCRSAEDEEDEEAQQYRSRVISAELSAEDLAKIQSHLLQVHGHHLTDEELIKLIEAEQKAETPRTKDPTGANMRKVAPMDAEEAPAAKIAGQGDNVTLPKGAAPALQHTGFGFAYDQIGIVDSQRTVAVKVQRTGNVNTEASVKYQTRPGRAQKDEDFTHVEGTLTFAPGESEKAVSVTVTNSVAFESNEEFYFDLIDAKSNATLAAAMLVILSNEDPGVVRFQEEEVTTVEEFQEKVLEVTVVRRHGAAGKVACAWRTEDNTAKAGTHYTAGSGVLEFEHGQMVAKLPLTVLPAGRYQLSSTVRIVLSSITGGAKFDASTEGGRELCMATVVIQPDPAVQERILRIHSALAVNWTKAHTAKSNWTAWKEQILNAVKLTDDEEEEEEEEDGHEQSGPAEKRRGCMQYINMAMTAVLGVPWKIFFSVIPPPGFCDGWLCFFCSLGGIGLLTAVVGDLAALLGCVLDIGSAITAITLVALGTSLPDTFASRQAAVQDPTADASVGNVTGSNSVNVFLGLGMPWTLGALFWTIGGADATWNERFQDKDFIVGTSWTGGAFVVEAGGLAFSVMVFSCCAISCVILLAIRRRAFGGELGGPRCFAYLSSIFLVGLWAIYIGLSCWYVLTQ